MPTEPESYDAQQSRAVLAALTAAHTLAVRLLSGEIPGVGVSQVDAGARFEGGYHPLACVYLTGEAAAVAYVVSLGGTQSDESDSSGIYRWTCARAVVEVGGVPVKVNACTQVHRRYTVD
jgi:hypothetical protein